MLIVGLSYCCWHLAVRGTLLYAVCFGLLCKIYPTAFQEPAVVNGFGDTGVLLLLMFTLSLLLNAFFPRPADYKGIFD